MTTITIIRYYVVVRNIIYDTMQCDIKYVLCVNMSMCQYDSLKRAIVLFIGVYHNWIS